MLFFSFINSLYLFIAQVTEYEKLEQQQQQQQQRNDDEQQEKLQYRKLCSEEQNSNNEEELQIKCINEREFLLEPTTIVKKDTDEISSFEKLKRELNKSINDNKEMIEQEDEYYDRMADAILYNDKLKEKENHNKYKNIDEKNFETSMQHSQLKTMQQSHDELIASNISCKLSSKVK